jgi:hypothetical protein
MGQQLRAYSNGGNQPQLCSQTPFSGVPGTSMSGDVLVAGYLVSL